MPIGFGLAGAHPAHTLSATAEEWMATHDFRPPSVPSPKTVPETVEVLRDYLERTQRNLGVLKKQLTDYDPELLILVGGDQNHEMFDDSNIPNIMIYVGEGDAWGHNLKRAQEPSEETLFTLKVDTETSRWLLHQLVTQEGFDVAFSGEQRSQGSALGISHTHIRPIHAIRSRPDIPTVLVWVSSYDRPSIPAQRCYDLGRALARLLKDDPRRIAIGGSGGLSHDPFGPRAGWIDEPMDRWFIEQIAAGNGRCTAMYTFDGMTMRGGTGETRSWITVAGAMEEMGSRAEVVDYIPSYKTVAGLCWAYWPEPAGTANH